MNSWTPGGFVRGIPIAFLLLSTTIMTAGAILFEEGESGLDIHLSQRWGENRNQSVLCGMEFTFCGIGTLGLDYEEPDWREPSYPRYDLYSVPVAASSGSASSLRPEYSLSPSYGIRIVEARNETSVVQAAVKTALTYTLVGRDILESTLKVGIGVQAKYHIPKGGVVFPDVTLSYLTVRERAPGYRDGPGAEGVGIFVMDLGLTLIRECCGGQKFYCGLGSTLTYDQARMALEIGVALPAK